jgi:hypothetical protein
MTVSTRWLNVLAAAVWYGGGIALVLKGGSLLVEAEALKPGLAWPWVAAGLALVLGGLQARFLFVKSCHKNLSRISALDRPRVWQFYSPRFFFFLALMIATGATLSRLAHGSYPFLIAVATADFVVAVSLLGSSYVYWQRRAFSRPAGSSQEPNSRPRD